MFINKMSFSKDFSSSFIKGLGKTIGVVTIFGTIGLLYNTYSYINKLYLKTETSKVNKVNETSKANDQNDQEDLDRSIIEIRDDSTPTENPISLDDFKKMISITEENLTKRLEQSLTFKNLFDKM
jgi:hypothetical protein